MLNENSRIVSKKSLQYFLENFNNVNLHHFPNEWFVNRFKIFSLICSKKIQNNELSNKVRQNFEKALVDFASVIFLCDFNSLNLSDYNAVTVDYIKEYDNEVYFKYIFDRNQFNALTDIEKNEFYFQIINNLFNHNIINANNCKYPAEQPSALKNYYTLRNQIQSDFIRQEQSTALEYMQLIDGYITSNTQLDKLKLLILPELKINNNLESKLFYELLVSKLAFLGNNYYRLIISKDALYLGSSCRYYVDFVYDNYQKLKKFYLGCGNLSQALSYLIKAHLFKADMYSYDNNLENTYQVAEYLFANFDSVNTHKFLQELSVIKHFLGANVFLNQLETLDFNIILSEMQARLKKRRNKFAINSITSDSESDIDEEVLFYNPSSSEVDFYTELEKNYSDILDNQQSLLDICRCCLVMTDDVYLSLINTNALLNSYEGDAISIFIDDVIIALKDLINSFYINKNLFRFKLYVKFLQQLNANKSHKEVLADLDISVIGQTFYTNKSSVVSEYKDIFFYMLALGNNSAKNCLVDFYLVNLEQDVFDFIVLGREMPNNFMTKDIISLINSIYFGSQNATEGLTELLVGGSGGFIQGFLNFVQSLDFHYQLTFVGFIYSSEVLAQMNVDQAMPIRSFISKFFDSYIKLNFDKVATIDLSNELTRRVFNKIIANLYQARLNSFDDLSYSVLKHALLHFDDVNSSENMKYFNYCFYLMSGTRLSSEFFKLVKLGAKIGICNAKIVLCEHTLLIFGDSSHNQKIKLLSDLNQVSESCFIEFFNQNKDACDFISSLFVECNNDKVFDLVKLAVKYNITTVRDRLRSFDIYQSDVLFKNILSLRINSGDLSLINILVDDVNNNSKNLLDFVLTNFDSDNANIALSLMTVALYAKRKLNYEFDLDVESSNDYFTALKYFLGNHYSCPDSHVAAFYCNVEKDFCVKFPISIFREADLTFITQLNDKPSIKQKVFNSNFACWKNYFSFSFAEIAHLESKNIDMVGYLSNIDYNLYLRYRIFMSIKTICGQAEDDVPQTLLVSSNQSALPVQSNVLGKKRTLASIADQFTPNCQADTAYSVSQTLSLNDENMNPNLL